MRTLSVAIPTSGALLDVHVGLSDLRRRALQRQGLAVPPLVRTSLLVDTGASMTLLDETMMRGLQLAPTGFTSFHSSSTGGVAERCNVYDVGLVLGGIATPDSFPIDPLPVMATSFINQPFEGLLGRDVLTRLQMAWNGPSRRLTLSYA